MALTEAQIESAIRTLDGWRRAGNTITREFSFDSFREAISFIVRIAFEAEQRDHHPELWNVYGRVRVTLSTHDAGGVTATDLDLARAINEINWR